MHTFKNARRENFLNIKKSRGRPQDPRKNQILFRNYQGQENCPHFFLDWQHYAWAPPPPKKIIQSINKNKNKNKSIILKFKKVMKNKIVSIK